MIANPQQRVGVRWKIYSNHVCTFVRNKINKTWVLMGKAVMILTPYVGCQEIVER